MPGALRGKSTHEILASGKTRSFVYYAPAGLDEDAPAPLVIVAHGFGMSADQMFEITEYAALAEREGFVIAFPNGQEENGPPWNVGDPDCILSSGELPLSSDDDSRFIDGLIAFVANDRCVDREHVFMTGFSMGGYLSNELGCNRTDLRAIAPHSGGSHDLSGCGGTIKPVIVFHFEDDAVVPYQCGTQARDRWIARNGCQSANPMVTSVKGGQCEYYRGCDDGGQVAMCSFTTPNGSRTVRDRGHGWSGGSTSGGSGGAAYAISETESATSLSWSFFKNYAW
jgi:polyhydroxybutyrate depolymerase